jgi:hypothetical protein
MTVFELVKGQMGMVSRRITLGNCEWNSLTLVLLPHKQLRDCLGLSAAYQQVPHHGTWRGGVALSWL